MRTVRRLVIAMAPIAAICATLAVSTGTASANANVVTAIHQQDLVINASGAVQRLRHLEATDKNDPSKLHAPIEAIAKKFAHAASVVSHSSADSALQRTGRHNWVVAVDEISSGFYRLGRGLHDASHGSKAAAARVLLDAERRINDGGKLLFKADRELHLHRGD